MHTVGHFLVKVSVISQSGSRYNSDAKLLTTNLLFTAAKLKSIQSPKTPPIMCCCLSLALETALGVSSSNIRLVTGIWMGLSQDFHKTKSLSYCLIPHFHCFLVYMCVCLCVPDPTASQTSTDVSRGVVGSHSIEEAPGSSEAFSLPLGSVWAAQEKKKTSPQFSPRPKPSPKLQRSPYCWQLSLLPFLLSNPPPCLH